MPGRGRPKKTNDNTKIKNPGMSTSTGARRGDSDSESSSDNDSNLSQESFADVHRDEAGDLREQLEQGELPSDSGSEGDAEGQDVERIVAKLRRTQKELNNRLKALANQVDKEGDSYKWRKEGLRIQHELGLKILQKCQAGLAALDNNQINLAREYLKAAIDIQAGRNKELRIADESKGGWETVAAYRSHPVADNTSDDKRIRRADKIGKERVAAKQKKNNNKPYRRPRFNNRPYRAPYQDDGDQERDYYRSYGSNRSQNAGQRQSYAPDRRRPTSQSVCFHCGVQGHWQSNCPNRNPKKD